jgi:hypothetical protein
MMQGFDITQIPHTLMTVESRHAVWIAGPGSVRHEVFGEEYNQQHMHRIAAATHGRSDVPVAAWLEPESGNVVIWAMGSKVGFLPTQIAAVWFPVLCNFKARYNVPIACQGTLDMPSAANNGVMGMVLWLPPLRPNVSQAPAPSGYPPVAAFASPQRDEATALRAELAKTKQDLDAALEKARNAALPAEELAKTQAELQRLGSEVEARQKELRSVEEALDIQAFGFYKPKYGFESSAQYTARLKGIRDEQQLMIKDNVAAPCDTTWTVGGSAAEGKKMVKQQAKLMLRAFNGECDAAIAKVRYDNAVTMQSRIEKAYADINKLGEVQRVFIAQKYLELKLAELHLVHEHREKVEVEKQEQKRIREQMREEQKALAEIERAKAEAEKEEAAKAAALEKAKAELAANDATSKQHEKLEALVSRLENELKSALDQKAKAIARAQLTRSGHVYVLSNVGSFGENIYKIGLTRRLDPFDRVEELGDASVPFPFDVHAIIFAEDAPALETKLHKAFADRRVNLVNMRKEYFKVTLDEIQEEVKKHHGFVSFTLAAEAEEFRKSLSARQAGVMPEFVEPPSLEMPNMDE